MFGNFFTKRLLFLLIILFSFTTIGCTSKQPITKTGFYFDTVITITAYDYGNDDILDDAFDLCKHYEQLLSRTIENSDISQLNKFKSISTLDSETLELLKTAYHYSTITNGAFDITCAPIMDLWNFTSEHPSIPEYDSIESTLSHVNYENIKFSNNVATLTNDANIDLGGIAKGFIADKLKEYLLDNDVTSGVINLGGNILGIGSKPTNETFNIGIQKPFYENQTIVTVKAKNLSVVTSGCYERYFESGGKRYHHIINPSTGYPVDNNLLSVTIISTNSIDGDALSTGCFVLGYDKAIELLSSLDDTEAIFIDNEYNILLTDGLNIDKNNIVTKK